MVEAIDVLRRIRSERLTVELGDIGGSVGEAIGKLGSFKCLYVSTVSVWGVLVEGRN